MWLLLCPAFSLKALQEDPSFQPYWMKGTKLWNLLVRGSNRTHWPEFHVFSYHELRRRGCVGYLGCRKASVTLAVLAGMAPPMRLWLSYLKYQITNELYKHVCHLWFKWLFRKLTWPQPSRLSEDLTYWTGKREGQATASNFISRLRTSARSGAKEGYR